MKTLKGREVYSQLVISSEEQKDKNDKPYYRARHGKTGFILSKDVHDEWKKGSITEFSLEEGEREVEDPETGVKSMVPSLAYAGHINNDQMINLAKQEGQLRAIENHFIKTYKLDDVTMDSLLETA